MKRIIGGERPSRPPEGRELGLSDDLWELIQSSLAHEAKKRPSVSTFVHFLEEATPNIPALRELIDFDANSEEHIQKLRYMFAYGNNTLLGMRENETLVVIEIFDHVSLLAHCRFTSTNSLWLRRVLGSQLLVERLGAPRPMFVWAPGRLRPLRPPAEELLDPP